MAKAYGMTPTQVLETCTVDDQRVWETGVSIEVAVENRRLGGDKKSGKAGRREAPPITERGIERARALGVE